MLPGEKEVKPLQADNRSIGTRQTVIQQPLNGLKVLRPLEIAHGLFSHSLGNCNENQIGEGASAVVHLYFVMN